MLRIAVFGQAPLAVDCLERLLAEGHEIAAVYAPPDGARPDALAARSRELELPVFQRRYFRKKSGEAIPSALASYRDLGAELNVLASMTSFLPREISDGPRHKSICFHPSLLPRYRGGNALQWQIIEGEPETGVSIFVPDQGVDTGPLVVQRGGVKIADDDTAGSLFFKKLCPLGVEALLEAVAAIDTGSAEFRPQDERLATFQGLVDDRVAAIDFSRPAAELDRLVRGSDPQPGAFARRAGEKVRLYDTRLEPETDAPPGTISAIDARGLQLSLVGAALRVGRVRDDGGKEAAQDWAQRSGVQVGDRLERG